MRRGRWAFCLSFNEREVRGERISMASPSTSSWIFLYPKNPEISHGLISFSISNLTFESTTTNDKRRRRRLLLLPKCSSHLHEDPSFVSPSSIEEGSKMMTKKTPKNEMAATPVADPSSAMSLDLTTTKGTRRKGRRNPIVLWKRIFFASKKVRSIILLNILTVIYASDIPVLKEVEQIMDPALFSVVRFGVTAIPFLPFLLHELEDCKIRNAGIELGLWVSLGYLSQALGLLTSEAGQASFISAFTIIVVPLIDGIFGATVPALTWTGALVSLLGVGILEYGGSPPCVGDILNIMSAVFFGVHILRTEQISRTTKREKFLALLGYQVSVVALSSAIWFICRDMFAEVHQLNFGSGSWEWSACWDLTVSFPWIPAIYTGIFSTGLCLLAEMDAMRDVSATETAIIYGLEPVWGAAFAWFLLGERWDTTEWIGAALVLCGSLTVQLLGSPHEESANKKRDGKKDFSLSTVVVETKKNSDIFRKQDKL